MVSRKCLVQSDSRKKKASSVTAITNTDTNTNKDKLLVSSPHPLSPKDKTKHTNQF